MIADKPMEAENHRTATTSTAPHPRVAMLDSFHDEPAAKPSDIKFFKGEKQNATEVNPGDNPSDLRHCPSTESWRTDTSVHEDEQRVPNRNFRENLGNSLSIEEIPQQQSGMRDPHEAVFR